MLYEIRSEQVDSRFAGDTGVVAEKANTIDNETGKTRTYEFKITRDPIAEGFLVGPSVQGGQGECQREQVLLCVQQRVLRCNRILQQHTGEEKPVRQGVRSRT